MKSANAYGRPSCAAQIALCGEEPSSHTAGQLGPPRQRRGEPLERVVLGQAVLEVGEQLGELLREVVGRGLATVALERERRQRIGARGAADPEVDPSRDRARRGSLNVSATLNGL